jgi:hypothetical protein
MALIAQAAATWCNFRIVILLIFEMVKKAHPAWFGHAVNAIRDGWNEA